MLLEVVLNKVGKTELDTDHALKRTIKVPVPDDLEASGAEWVKHFDAQWPTGKDFADKPRLSDVLLEGVKTLVRRATVAAMVKEYREKHPSSGGRGRKGEMQFEEIKSGGKR